MTTDTPSIKGGGCTYVWRPSLPVRRWQVGFELRTDHRGPRSLVVLVHARTGDGSEIGELESPWAFSSWFDAVFAYVPEGSAGDLVLMPAWDGDVYVAEVTFEVQTFHAPGLEPSSVLGPAVVLDLDATPASGHPQPLYTIYALAPEVSSGS